MRSLNHRLNISTEETGESEESLSAKEIKVDLVELTEEFELLLDNKESDGEFDAEQADEAAKEVIEIAIESIETLIATNKCTNETAWLINQGTRSALDTLGFTRPMPSLESFDGSDIVAQHKLALESFQDALNTYNQTEILRAKKAYNGTVDLFKSTAGQLKKYKTKLEAAKKEYESKKGEMTQANYNVNLSELWQHFSTAAGPTEDIIAAIRKDLGLSEYILTKYPTLVIDTMKKLVALTTSAAMAKDPAAIKTFLKSVEGLHSGVELFDKSFIVKGHPYLSVTGVEVKVGSSRAELIVDGQAFTKLAALATASVVAETSSVKHAIKKALVNEMWTDLKYKSGEIATVIDFGQDYIKNVEKYLTHGAEIDKLGVEFTANLIRMGASAKSMEADGKVKGQIKKAISQVDQIYSNLLHCFKQPAGDEVARSIKGAKYCQYLALRLIYNATGSVNKKEKE